MVKMHSMPERQRREGHVIISAKVKANQPEFSIVKNENMWIIHVKSAPENNKANIEIIKELKKTYRNVRILSGLKSPKKKILIEIML